MRKNEFTLEDFLEQMGQVKKMGGIGKMLDMIPGMQGRAVSEDEISRSEQEFRQMEAIIYSMTPEEREKFFDALFSILHDTNAATLRELSENWYKNALIMARSLKNMDEASRKLMAEVLRLLLRAARNNVSILLPRRPRREDASAELCPAEQTPALKGGAQANKEE